MKKKTKNKKQLQNLTQPAAGKKVNVKKLPWPNYISSRWELNANFCALKK